MIIPAPSTRPPSLEMAHYPKTEYMTTRMQLRYSCGLHISPEFTDEHLNGAGLQIGMVLPWFVVGPEQQYARISVPGEHVATWGDSQDAVKDDVTYPTTAWRSGRRRPNLRPPRLKPPCCQMLVPGDVRGFLRNHRLPISGNSGSKCNSCAAPGDRV